MAITYENYKSSLYDPADVTGLYGRIQGSKKKGYTYVISETLSCKRTGKAGHGYTAWEYIVDGSELSEEIKTMLQDKTTHRIGNGPLNAAPEPKPEAIATTSQERAVSFASKLADIDIALARWAMDAAYVGMTEDEIKGLLSAAMSQSGRE